MVDDKAKEIQDRARFVETTEKVLEQERAVAKEIAEQCQRLFDAAIPALRKSIAKMKRLTKVEMTELKSIKRPSPAVASMLKCVCVMLKVPPKKIKSGDTYTMDWWAAAASPKVLGNPQIIDKLAGFDPDNLDVEMMRKVKAVMDSTGDVNDANIGKACKAAKGIYRWLTALTGYYYVYEENKPRRDALLLAQV